MEQGGFYEARCKSCKSWNTESWEKSWNTSDSQFYNLVYEYVGGKTQKKIETFSQSPDAQRFGIAS